MSTTASAAAPHKHVFTDDPDYQGFLERIMARYDGNTAGGAAPVFRTTADGDRLWNLYLSSFAGEERQHHNCSACRHFIQHFGSLVVVNETGVKIPAFWEPRDTPSRYLPAIYAMGNAVYESRIDSVFLSGEKVFGTPRTGEWSHMALTNKAVFIDPVMTGPQAMAAKREDFRTVTRALEEFKPATVQTALTLLRAGNALYRSEKVLGQAEWLAERLAERSASCSAEQRHNMLWRAIATAPAGFCHPRSSMIGTLLEDIEAGLPFATVEARFASKMHPLQYQRPQAEPKAGAIEAAEKLVDKMGLASALQRRFARPDELKAVWTPKNVEKAPAAGGVFAALKQGTSAPVMTAPAGSITWDKFRRTVLPTAERVEVYFASGHVNFTHFTTAVDAEAQPLLQWDFEHARNPVGWYCWASGAPASQYGLSSGVYHDVTAIVLSPPHWDDENAFSHHDKRATFLIDGAHETRNPSLALFPELLKGDLHAVRSVIEAHSNRGQLAGLTGQPHAMGPYVSSSKGGSALRVRVKTGGQRLEYTVDRWD